MDADRLRQYLEFYQDLGIKSLYRQPVTASAGSTPDGEEATPAAPSLMETATPAEIESAVPPDAERPAAAKPAIVLPGMAAPNETMFQILEDLGECRRCRLHSGRTKIVFGTGNEHSPLVFVGEGPGADEDAQGIPFVGRAGQLLTQMIEGTAKKEGIELRREDVYICNVVKCRPPDNRTPEPDEMAICGEFLFRQLMAIRPKAICALGGTAARALTGHKEGVTKMRGRWFSWAKVPAPTKTRRAFPSWGGPANCLRK